MTRILAIDTDPGIDDALALMLAFSAPAVQIVLVSTVAGNVPVSVATANARRLLGLLDADAETVLARGSARPLDARLTTARHVHGSDGLAGLSAARSVSGEPFFPTPGPAARRGAVDLLIEAVRTHGPELTLIALGPLTNVALAVERAPQVMATIGRIVVMGGAIDVPGNISAVAEFNFHVDALAAERVLGAGLPLTLVPLDVTRQVLLKPGTDNHIASGRLGRLPELVHRLARDGFAGAWRGAGMPMHDPLAVAVALHPELVTTTTMAVRVEHQGRLTRGQCVVDQRAPHGSGTDQRVPVSVALDVDSRAALDRISSALFGQQRGQTLTGAKPESRRVPGVAVLGGANIDYVVVVPRLPTPGETVAGKDLMTGFGGKGANQALAARRAGCPVQFLSLLGRDAAGESFREALRAQKIELREPAHRGQPPTGTALICVDAQGENHIAVAPGANRRFNWHRLENADRILDSCAVLVSQFELPMGSVIAAFRAARARRLTTVLNATPIPTAGIPERLKKLVDVLVVNESEAAMITLSRERLSAGRRASTDRTLRTLQEMGFATVVLTLGAQGAIRIDEDGIHRQAPFTVQSIDSTGAGDTFVGYLAAAIARGLPVAKAVCQAAAAGALAVTRSGAQGAIPRLSQVTRLTSLGTTKGTTRGTG